jgi:hypothetical protein
MAGAGGAVVVTLVATGVEMESTVFVGAVATVVVTFEAGLASASVTFGAVAISA